MALEHVSQSLLVFLMLIVTLSLLPHKVCDSLTKEHIIVPLVQS